MLAALLTSLALAAPPKASLYEQDIAFALGELEKRCGHFFATKGVDWKAVAAEFEAAAKAVRSDSAHFGVLIRLVARLRDGHAEVRPGPHGKDVAAPDDFAQKLLAPGFHFCRDAKTKKLFVKAAWGSAAQAGLQAGMEVTRVDGKPAAEWVDARVAYWRDRRGFSTGAHALAFALTVGLAQPRGTRIEIAAKAPKGAGAAKSIAFSVNSDDARAPGPPAPPPPNIARDVAGLVVATTKSGFGYVHVRKIHDDLPSRLDQALAALDNPKGLILDLRGNTGGGCDHDQLLGLFVPKGEQLDRADAYTLPSYGEHPYGGPVVVIVDALVVSSGETVAGTFKEDGRAFLIGEDHTAGMSGSKEDIELPSGLFTLHVVTRTNKGRFNGGKGIEGIGVAPHEVVSYAPADLAGGVDTLLARAEALLAKFPQREVPYDPAKHGWKPSP